MTNLLASWEYQFQLGLTPLLLPCDYFFASEDP